MAIQIPKTSFTCKQKHIAKSIPSPHEKRHGGWKYYKVANVGFGIDQGFCVC